MTFTSTAMPLTAPFASSPSTWSGRITPLTDARRARIVFEGVEAYFLEHDLGSNIVFRQDGATI